MRLMIVLMAGLGMLGCGGEEAAAGGDEPTEDHAATDESTETEHPSNENADTSIPGDPEAGEAVYVANCQACHGADGRGNGGVGGDFVGDPERLQQDNAVLLGKIADGISGARTMPPMRDILSVEERTNALSYIRQTFGTSE